MKKTLLGLVAMAGMLAATSCSQESDLNVVPGQPAKVTFNVGVDEIAATRSVSDGLSADILYYEVYDEAGTNLVTEGTAEVTNLSSTFTASLVTGATYQVLFWAQTESCTLYDTDDLRAVKIDYSNGVQNNYEEADAFCAKAEVQVTETTETQKVTLKRPFAQVNVGISEGNFDGLGVSNSSVTVKSYYDEINLLTGDLGELVEESLTFTTAALPTDLLTVGGKDYNYLSTTYLLAPADEAENVNMYFEIGNYSLTYDNVPIQRNFRTNILTDQSMDEVDFEITIDPAYGGNNDEEGDLDQNESPVSVTALTATASDDNVNFSASFNGDKASIESAEFVCTPVLSGMSIKRMAEAGVVTVSNVTINETTITATEPLTSFEAGTNYTVTLKINGATAEFEGTTAPTLEVPSVGGGDEPEGPTGTPYEYSMTTPQGDTKQNNNYNSSGTMEVNGLNWTLEGNLQMAPWRLGGKSITAVDRSVYTADAVPATVTEFEFAVGSATITVNSMKVTVAQDASFSSVLYTEEPEFAVNKTYTIKNTSNTPWTNCYYKVTFNVTNTGGSNNYVQFVSAKFTGTTTE